MFVDDDGWPGHRMSMADELARVAMRGSTPGMQFGRPTAVTNRPMALAPAARLIYRHCDTGALTGIKVRCSQGFAVGLVERK